MVMSSMRHLWKNMKKNGYGDELYGKNMWAAAKTFMEDKFKYAVNLGQKTCSCKAWQVSGQPCTHALAYISKISREVRMEDFVHEYFSVDRFKKAYECSFNPMTSKDNWPHVNLPYKINKPKLRRKPGRPRTSRVKSFDEAATSKKRKPCSECGELGHIAKYC